MTARTSTLIVVMILNACFLMADTGQSSLFVVHFETGPKWKASVAPSDQDGFRDHSANMSRLRKQGAIVFGARYGELGIIVLKAETLDKAREVIESDPGVRSGIFGFRIEPLHVFYPWQE